MREGGGSRGDLTPESSLPSWLSSAERLLCLQELPWFESRRRLAVLPTQPMLSFISNLRSNDADETLGPDQIIEAVYGNREVYDTDRAVMGEPRLKDFGTDYFTDYYIQIPLHIEEDMALAPILYNVPDDPQLEGSLSVLAQRFGVSTIEDIADLEGGEVPIKWTDGHARPDFNVLRSEAGSDPDLEAALQEDSE